MSAKRRVNSREPIRCNERSAQRYRAGDGASTEHGRRDKRTGPKDGRTDPHRSVTGWRLWLFRLGALIVVPVVLLMSVELSLRVVGYGFSPAAIVKCKMGGKDAWCDNPKFGWRFFPYRMARELVPFVFPAAKSEDTYRIFVLGESAVKGEPDSAYCFGRLLRVMLQEEYPEIRFEIVIVAMPAINANMIVEMAKDCARHQPDLVIVYAGNNEVVGPYGAGTVFTPPVRHMSLIRAGIAVKATRMGQIITEFLGRVDAGENEPEAWRGLEIYSGT